MIKTYFKMVGGFRGKLLSFNSQDTSLPHCLEYKVGEYVYPKLENTYQFVFESITHLCEYSRWYNFGHDYVVYSCVCDFVESDPEDFISTLAIPGGVPLGTKFVKGVKLGSLLSKDYLQEVAGFELN